MRTCTYFTGHDEIIRNKSPRPRPPKFNFMEAGAGACGCCGCAKAESSVTTFPREMWSSTQGRGKVTEALCAYFVHSDVMKVEFDATIHHSAEPRMKYQIKALSTSASAHLTVLQGDISDRTKPIVDMSTIGLVLPDVSTCTCTIFTENCRKDLYLHIHTVSFTITISVWSCQEIILRRRWPNPWYCNPPKCTCPWCLY